MASRLILRRKLKANPAMQPIPVPAITLVKFSDIGVGELFTVNKYPGSRVFRKEHLNGWSREAEVASSNWRKFKPYDGVFKCEVISVKE